MQPSYYPVYFECEERDWWFVSHRAIVLSLLKPLLRGKTEAKILDAGCGTGMTLLEMSRLADVIGIDNSPIAVRLARSRGLENVEVGNFQEQPYPNGRFDGITCLDCFEHIREDKNAAKAAFAMLKPGGFLLFTVPAFSFLWSGHDIVNEHFRRYTRHQMAELLSGAGFRITFLSYYNFWLFPFAVALSLGGRLGDQLRGSGADGSRYVNRKLPPAINALLTRIFSSEAALLRWVRFPWGASLVGIAVKEQER